MKAAWLLPIIGALLGGLVFVYTLLLAPGAPQQAAGYAMSVALAVIPYVLVRAGQFMVDNPAHDDIRRIARAVESLAKKSD